MVGSKSDNIEIASKGDYYKIQTSPSVSMVYIERDENRYHYDDKRGKDETASTSAFFKEY